MENLFGVAISNPIYIAILAIIFILLIYAIIKKIIKLVISLGIILIAYVLYLNYTGQEVPKTVEVLKKSASGNVDKAKEVLMVTCDTIKFFSKEDEIFSIGNSHVRNSSYDLKADTITIFTKILD